MQCRTLAYIYMFVAVAMAVIIRGKNATRPATIEYAGFCLLNAVLLSLPLSILCTLSN